MITQHKEVSMKQKSLNCLFITTIAVFLVIIAYMPLEAASLNMGQVEGSPGDQVTIPLTLSQGTGIVALSADISYDTAALNNPKAEIGNTAQSSGKDVHVSIPKQGIFRVSVFGMNLDEIPDGTIALVTFDVSPTAPSKKNIELKITSSASDAQGNVVTISADSGVVKIE